MSVCIFETSRIQPEARQFETTIKELHVVCHKLAPIVNRRCCIIES